MILHLGPNLFQCIRVGFYFFFSFIPSIGGRKLYKYWGFKGVRFFFFLANRTDSIACILKKSMLRRLCFEVLFCYFGTTAGFFIFRPVVKPVRRWLRKVAKTIVRTFLHFLHFPHTPNAQQTPQNRYRASTQNMHHSQTNCHHANYVYFT